MSSISDEATNTRLDATDHERAGGSSASNGSPLDHATRAAARARALRTARAITLGFAITAASTGCEQVATQYCATFARGPSGMGDGSAYCCARQGGRWDAASSQCISPMYSMPVPGPFVPPVERA